MTAPKVVKCQKHVSRMVRVAHRGVSLSVLLCLDHSIKANNRVQLRVKDAELAIDEYVSDEYCSWDRLKQFFEIIQTKVAP